MQPLNNALPRPGYQQTRHASCTAMNKSVVQNI